MIRLSNIAKRTMGFRRAVHAKTGGRCFYCGTSLICGNEQPARDWLLINGGNWMVPDHAHPRKRGGDDSRENALPSCWKCNSLKGALTVEEFRSLRAFRERNMLFRFACEDPAVQRDWLFVASEQSVRDLFLHNNPAAKGAFSRRGVRSRSGNPDL